ELFLTRAARMHQRVPGESSYLDWANREWSWLSASGMINDHHLINDGLNDQCQNNGEPTWTYNQGVILGGLVEMFHCSGNPSYLDRAEAIADAAIRTLVHERGILREPCEPDCGRDGWQFKGIFMRNLSYFSRVRLKPAYTDFILN